MTNWIFLCASRDNKLMYYIDSRTVNSRHRSFRVINIKDQTEKVYREWVPDHVPFAMPCIKY